VAVVRRGGEVEGKGQRGRWRCVASAARPPGDLFGGEVAASLSGGKVAAARCRSRGWCADAERGGAWAQAAGLGTNRDLRWVGAGVTEGGGPQRITVQGSIEVAWGGGGSGG
jgi:hypothetical protein